MLLEIAVLKNFANLTGKHLCWESVFNKVAGLQACNFVKKRLQHRCYLVKFSKFLRTLFFTEHLLTVTVSVCSENLAKIIVRMLAGNNFTENFAADIPVGIFQNL